MCFTINFSGTWYFERAHDGSRVGWDSVMLSPQLVGAMGIGLGLVAIASSQGAKTHYLKKKGAL